MSVSKNQDPITQDNPQICCEPNYKDLLFFFMFRLKSFILVSELYKMGLST